MYYTLCIYVYYISCTFIVTTSINNGYNTYHYFYVTGFSYLNLGDEMRQPFIYPRSLILPLAEIIGTPSVVSEDMEHRVPHILCKDLRVSTLRPSKFDGGCHRIADSINGEIS